MHPVKKGKMTISNGIKFMVENYCLDSSGGAYDEHKG